LPAITDGEGRLGCQQRQAHVGPKILQFFWLPKTSSQCRGSGKSYERNSLVKMQKGKQVLVATEESKMPSQAEKMYIF